MKWMESHSASCPQRVVGSLLEEEEEAEEREGSVISDEKIGQEGKGREKDVEREKREEGNEKRGRRRAHFILTRTSFLPET